MNERKPSLLRKLLIAYLAFGLAMGILFPVYAQFFVEWKPGLQIWFIVGCLIAGAIVGISNYAMLRIILLKPLTRIANVAEAISHHDISTRAKFDSQDMIGTLSSSCDRMADNLNAVIHQIKDMSEVQMNSMTELSKLSGVNSENSAKQKSAIEMIQAAMEELSISAQDVARHTKQSATMATNAHLAVNEGNNTLSESIDTIANLVKEAEQSTMAMKKLLDDSDAIGGVLAIISTIAEQTNLLALNASIEAARAGEYGRGFAVVAEEVRTLANRTKESTKETRLVIERQQMAALVAVKTMETWRIQAKTAIASTAKARSCLQGSKELIRSITEDSHQLSTIASQQSKVIQALGIDITELYNQAEQTSAQVEKAMLSSNSVIKNAHDLNKLVNPFKTVSAQNTMSNSSKHFK